MSNEATKEVDVGSQKNWTPNKVDIKSITLFRFDNVSSRYGKSGETQGINLAPSFTSVEIDQSMYSPFVSMKIVVGAPMGLVENFGPGGLQGEEFILVEFNTKARRMFSMVFFVTHVDTTSDVLDQGQVATFNCVAIEKLYNDISTVNQSFKSTMSRAAQKIFQNKIVNNPTARKLGTVLNQSSAFWSSTTNLEVIEHTQREEDFIIPGFTPFDAINFCLRRSYSSRSLSSYFLFYQTSQGFRYDSVEARIQKGKQIVDGVVNEAKRAKEGVDPTGLFFTNQHNAGAFMDAFSGGLNRNIKSATRVSRPDTLQRLNEGAFFNNVRAIDFYGKNYTDTEFKIRNKYNGFERLGDKFSLSDSFVETVCENEEFDFQYFQDTTRRNQAFEKIIGSRLAYIDLLTTYGLNIVVPGDSEIVPGDVIWVDLGEANVGLGGLEGTPLVESLFSRMWLVVGHKIIFDQGEITSVLTIVKDSIADVNKGDR